MRRLTIVVASADPARFHAALSLAAAQAALERPARLFLQGEAAGLLRQPMSSPADPGHKAAGLPTLGELYEEAAALGVEFIACQSGLALCGIAAEALPAGTGVGGLVSLLADADDDQLLLA
ncbi:MAG TPA: peroxiredoxin [Allosphingosinicella sp.]|jgi:predicted peroxiredoxin